MNIAIITAKGGNLSIPNKNLIEVNGKSLLGHVIETARKASMISSVLVSTENDNIKNEAKRYGAEIIDRPCCLAKPDSNHGEAILHAFSEAEKRYPKIEHITILLGNSILIQPEDIDNCILRLMQSPQATSCMTVWQAQDDHPYRAMKIDEKGYLRSFHDYGIHNTNRQSYPDVFFYDQGPWCVRAETLKNAYEKHGGPACWWWMGERSIAIVRPWVTGRDVHTFLDVAVHAAYNRKQMWKLK